MQCRQRGACRQGTASPAVPCLRHGSPTVGDHLRSLQTPFRMTPVQCRTAGLPNTRGMYGHPGTRVFLSDSLTARCAKRSPGTLLVFGKVPRAEKSLDLPLAIAIGEVLSNP